LSERVFMGKKINFGIGFIAGRPNVCNIINRYYKFLIEQVKDLDVTIDFTIFILFDLNYLHTTRMDFYSVLPEVYKNIKIKYITPEEIDEEKKKLISIYDLSKEDADLLIGHGYAKARNTILLYAMKRKIDYLLFWDDDEYPLAVCQENKELTWIKQKNVLTHINNIKSADITYGYRCGMMSPVPYVQYDDNIKEEDYKAFIDALENEVISWEKMQKLLKENRSISYANKEIATGEVKPEVMKSIGVNDYVLGSGICLNLNHINKIPAFYNPPGARGEDTFFSCALGEKNAKVLRVPTYHFHDSFMKYTNLMKDNFPKVLRRISIDDNGIEQRFLKTTIGWIKYKPLFYYIIDRDNYRRIINDAKKNLAKSVDKMSTAFETCDFSCLTRELEDYDKKVKKHYDEYVRTNEIWDKLKIKLKEQK